MHKYYQTLGLNRNASLAQIKSAYYELSKKYHPDVNASDEAHQRFIEINEAYEILTRLKSLLSSPYAAKKVTKTWVKKQQKKAKSSTPKKSRRARSVKEVSKEVKKKMFRKDVFKVIRAYIYILLFFGGLASLAYMFRTKDNDLSLELAVSGYILFASITTIVFCGVGYHFYMYYFRD